MSLAQSFRGSVRQALDRQGQILVEQVQSRLRKAGKSATGELVQSITYEVDGNRLILIAEAEHAIYVHEGTDPHWAPKGAMTEWVKQTGFASGLDIESRDYLARKSVAETGTRAYPFFDLTLTAQARAIAINLRDTIIDDMQSRAAQDGIT